MTEAEYCQFALDIQDACNLSGVVLSWSKALQTCDFFQGTSDRNTHPATQLVVDKLADLARRPSIDDYCVACAAYDYCQKQVSAIGQKAAA